MRNFTCLLLAMLSTGTIFSQDGTLDPTFSTDGKAFANAPSLNADWGETIVTPEGKVIIVGKAANCCGYDIAVARFNADGTLDNTFDGDGVLVFDFGLAPNVWEYPHTVAVQPDGKIIIGGVANQDLALVRLNNDGSFDNTFDGDGKVTTHIAGVDEIYSIVLQNDGKIVAAGSSSGGTQDMVVARYLSNGTLDNTFDGDGIAIAPFGPSVDIAYSVMLQPDGKIVIAGASGGNFALARYLPNGSLDPLFGTGGLVTTDFGAGDAAYSIALQPDGKIVAAGVSEFTIAVARYLPDGTLDNTFDGDGRVIGDFSTFDQAYSVVVQTDGKIVIGGTSNNGPLGDDFMLWRLLSNGTPDPTLDTDGLLLIDMGGGEAYATVTGSGNKLVIGGYSSGQLAVARLLNSSPIFVLPVRLSTFTVQLQNDQASLRWQTSFEQNSAFFEIQRSGDGHNFLPIGSVQASGNSDETRTYTFTDRQLLPSTGFYRLRMVDQDGKSSYSQVIAIRRTGGRLTVFNNVVRQALKVQVQVNGPATLQVIHSNGALVKEQRINSGTTAVSLDVSALSSGTYILLLKAGAATESFKFIKQ
jgi:uncharacterized delta-60 repeat protein